MENLPPFIQGLELNRKFFQQVVKPLLDTHFPGLPYAAGLVGEGSDVLGFDNPQSMDHNWGPHLRLILQERDFKKTSEGIGKMFREHLPVDFMGFPTNFTEPVETYLVQRMKPVRKGPVNHLIQCFTIQSFFEHYLGFDPSKDPTEKDWLMFPQQALLEATGGEVFYDQVGFEEARGKFAYYPDDVWLYLYATQWARIGDEEAFMGRSGEVGDELGSNVITTHLVTNIMYLCFLMEKRYAPYIKWFGSAFSRLRCASELVHPMISATRGTTWVEREEHLSVVYEIIARMHNDLGITKKIPTAVQEFEGRPYKVLKAYDVYNAVTAEIQNPFLKNLKYRIGSVDQFTDLAKINRLDYLANEFKKVLF